MVMGIHTSQKALEQKQAGHHQKIPGHGALGGGELHLLGSRGFPRGVFIGGMPPEPFVAAEDREGKFGH